MEEIPKQEMRESGSIKASIVDISLRNPCALFQEAFNALLRCLGFEDSTSSASNTDSQTESTTEDDPPTSTSVVNAATTLKATKPTRPKVDPGPGPQTN